MKYIQIPETHKEKILNDFTTFLYSNTRTADTKITYTYNTDQVTDTSIIKPEVFFTAEAWLKTMLLIQENNNEIAWHGVVSKFKEKYLITDILVYPQKVTGMTVEADDDKYPIWCADLEVEIANKMRLQGHSHVHMSTTPSGVDKEHYNTILQTLKTDGWYIFIIFNKAMDYHIELHDYAQNIIFEKEDIALNILLSSKTTTQAWLDTVKDNITSPYTTPYYKQPQQPTSYYDKIYNPYNYCNDDEDDENEEKHTHNRPQTYSNYRNQHNLQKGRVKRR